MKTSIPVLALLAVVSLAAQPAFANIEGHGEHMQVMRQAANELQASNPGLAKKLNEFADKKEKMKGEGKEMIEQKREDLQKIRKAAGELEDDDSALADDLNDMANRWEKKLDDKVKKY